MGIIVRLFVFKASAWQFSQQKNGIQQAYVVFLVIPCFSGMIEKRCFFISFYNLGKASDENIKTFFVIASVYL